MGAVRHSPARLLLPALLLVAGCSFQGSVSDGDGGSSSHSRSSTSTSASASSATSDSSSSGSPTATSSSGSAGRCHTADLAGSLQPGDSGAGQRHATLVLRNTSGRSCTVRGYGGIGLVDASGAPLPTHQNRVSAPAAATVSLRPGGSASSQLHWGAVPGTGDATTGDCQPTPAALQVIPPDETSALSIPWAQGPVCEGGTIDQQAYAAG